jgi:hypothetical protein
VLRTVTVACLVAALLTAGASPARATGDADELLPLAGDRPTVVPNVQPVPPPAPPVRPFVPPASPVKTHRQPYLALYAVGAVTFGLIYGLTIMGAALSWNGIDGDCNTCSTQAALFLIPVAGPWLADSDPRSQGFNAAWSGIEAASLTMLIVGLVGREVPDVPARALPGKVSVVPMMTAKVEGLSLRWSW